MTDIRKLFSANAIALALNAQLPLKMINRDRLFKEANRRPYYKSLVEVAEFGRLAQAVPVVARNGRHIAIGGDGAQTLTIEPLPIKTYESVSAADVADLDRLGDEIKRQFVSDRVGYTKRVVDQTIEVLAAQCWSGKIDWALKEDDSGQYDRYQIDFGTPTTVPLTDLHDWSAGATTIAHIYGDLDDLAERLQNQGYGADIQFEASKEAYAALLAKTERRASGAAITVRAENDAINVGGYIVRRNATNYKDVATGETKSAIASKRIVAYDASAPHTLLWTQIDAFEENGQLTKVPLRIFAALDPSQEFYSIYGSAKPLPIPVVNAIAHGVVAA
jgi:hypothetical protein